MKVMIENKPPVFAPVDALIRFESQAEINALYRLVAGAGVGGHHLVESVRLDLNQSFPQYKIAPLQAVKAETLRSVIAALYHKLQDVATL